MFLQSPEPLAHVLHYSIQRLYKSLLSRFVEVEVLSAADSNLDSIGINLETNLKSLFLFPKITLKGYFLAMKT